LKWLRAEKVDKPLGRWGIRVGGRALVRSRVGRPTTLPRSGVRVLLHARQSYVFFHGGTLNPTGAPYLVSVGIGGLPLCGVGSGEARLFKKCSIPGRKGC